MKGSGEFDPGYISVRNLHVSRVNIIATVVEKFFKDDQSYASVLVDDSSGYLSLKLWKENTKLFTPLNIGDLILLVGKVREYNNTIYVSPDIVKRLDNPAWAKLRRTELVQLYGQPALVAQEQESIRNEPSPETIVQEERVTEEPVNKRQIILDLIETLSSPEGADRMHIILQSRIPEADALIQELIKEGEIFEASPGKLKIMN